MKNFNENIDSKIEKHKTTILNLLASLLEFESTVENTKDISLYCADILRKIGLEVELINLGDMNDYSKNKFRTLNRTDIDYKDKYNVIAKYKGKKATEKGKSIIFNGHLDVVPPGPLELWDSNPWKANIKNGKVFGRGSLDMKSGISCAIVATMILKKLGVELLGDVIIELVIDEELGGNSTLYNIINGVNAEAAVFCEPTGLDNIVVGSRGGMSFQVEIYNEVSANIDSRGDNWQTLKFLQVIIDSIKDFSRLRKKKTKKGIFSKFENPVPIYVGRIECGNWFSSIPNKCTVEGVMGWLPDDNPKELKKTFSDHIKAFLKDKSTFSGKNKLVINFDKVLVEPFLQDADMDIAQITKEIISKKTNYNPKITIANFGSDQRLRTIYGKSKTIMLGPNGGKAHCPNEYVLIDSIIDCTRIFTHLILGWCNYKS